MQNQKFLRLETIVQRGSYPHVSFVTASCAQAIRLVGGMAAFDRRKIDDFEFKAIARSIDEIHQSIRFDFETALIRSPARSRLLLPCQCVPLQNEIPLLFLNIDVTQLSMMQGGFSPSFAQERAAGAVAIQHEARP